MKALVIYDSLYGNTKKIAETIAQELDAKVISVSEYNPKELEGIELLLVGSPIHGWRPSEKTLEFLSSLGKGQLNGIKAASFDTRVKLFIHGDAAGKISKALESAGATIITPPEPFYVQGKESSLFEGEVEKAQEWAKTIKEKGE